VYEINSLTLLQIKNSLNFP